jgi:uncharacterized protein YjbI with pentapeptide repeats
MATMATGSSLHGVKVGIRLDERIGLTKKATSTRCSASAREEPREDPRASFAFKSAGGPTAAALALTMGSPAAIAGVPKGQGVKSTDELGRTDVDRCSLEALGKGASTRAAFSDFATEQNKELYVNVEGCDYSNMDLSKEVLSGIKARGANFSNSIFPKEASRADFSDANLAGAVIRSANLFNSIFAGTNMENADISGSLASGAYFGKDPQTGTQANMKGVNLEGTLFAVSDVKTICLNRTLEFEAQAELGC